MTCFTPTQAYEAKGLTKLGKIPSTRDRSKARTVNGFPIERILPCHRCEGCRLDYSKEWSVRIMHEASLYFNEDMHEYQNSFITLTYNDKFMPLFGALDYFGHWESFLKRFRLFLAEQNIFIRYYMVGEYGELNLRPHYHAIIFGYTFPDLVPHKESLGNIIYTSDILKKYWSEPYTGESYGYSSVGEVNILTAAYVARYSMKKQTPKGFDGTEEYYDPNSGLILTRSKPQERYVRYHRETGDKIIVPGERSLMSRKPGIAKAWFDKHYDSVYRVTDLCGASIYDETIHINGKRVVTPKFYDKQLEKINPELLDNFKKSRQDSMSVHADEFTPERLAVRRDCLKARLKHFKRNLGATNDL